MNLMTLQNFAIGYIAIWAISPPIFGSDIARLLVFASAFIWGLVEIFRPGGLTDKVTLPVLLAFLFIGYTGLVEVLFYGAEGVIRGIQIWIMLFFLIVGQSRRNNLKSLLPVFWSVIAAYPIWLLITIATLTTTDAHAARTIVRGGDAALELTRQGVGGYQLVYGTLIFIPVLWSMLRNRKVLKGLNLAQPLRVFPMLAYMLILLNFLLGVLLVLTAGFTIAVIALVSILISLLLVERYKTERVVFAVLAALAAAIYANPILEVSLLALQPFTEGTNYYWKIRDILVSLQVGEASGTASVRAERYMRSLETFVENPLIGVLSFENSGIGKHSQILDGFARWGVVFGGIFAYLVCFPALQVLWRGKHTFGVALATLVATLIIFGLNNGFAAAGVMLYVMFPVSIQILQRVRTHAVKVESFEALALR